MPHPRTHAWMEVAALAAVVLACAAPPAVPAEQAASAAAAAPAPVSPVTQGKAADGATKAAVCAACHGPNGNSTNPDWPRLAGQSAVYVAQQLQLFKAGTRANPVMMPMATSLSAQDMADIAVYYEAQTPLGLEADPSTWQAGEALYLRGDRTHDIPACAACHGPAGRGNLAAGYPALRAQQSAYVVKQLNDYASGARYANGAVPAADPNAVMMFTIAKRLTPEQVRSVASYVQGMR